MNESHVNRVVRVRTATATPDDLGPALVVAYADRPTFVLERPDGSRFTWIADLCAGATPEDAAAYWRERAETAEAALASRPPAEGRGERPARP